MSDQAADLLMAAARELRLRRYMGPLPFDVDEWMRQDQECDLPRLDDGEAEYHFEVRTHDHYEGTYFTLGLDGHGKPVLTVGSIDLDGAGPYPADLDGWRAVATEFNRFAPESIVEPRKYIWLHGNAKLVHAVDVEHQARLNQAIMAHVVGRPEAPEFQSPETVRRPSVLRSLTRRLRRG